MTVSMLLRTVSWNNMLPFIRSIEARATSRIPFSLKLRSANSHHEWARRRSGTDINAPSMSPSVVLKSGKNELMIAVVRVYLWFRDKVVVGF